LPSLTQGGSPVRELRSLGSDRGYRVTGIPTAILGRSRPLEARRQPAVLRPEAAVHASAAGMRYSAAAWSNRFDARDRQKPAFDRRLQNCPKLSLDWPTGSPIPAVSLRIGAVSAVGVL